MKPLLLILLCLSPLTLPPPPVKPPVAPPAHGALLLTARPAAVQGVNSNLVAAVLRCYGAGYTISPLTTSNCLYLLSVGGCYPPPRTNWQFTYNGAWRAGTAITLLSSTNLATPRSNWTVIATIIPTNQSPPVQFSAPLTTNKAGFWTIKNPIWP
jgi:hypothetical protein